ncbi:2793_t:CDS:2, partial [Gigaspora margarita]
SKVLKDDKEKAFVLEYSSRNGKRGFQEGKVDWKEKVQKIKNCQEKEKLLEEGKVVRKRERKKRLSRKVKVVEGRECLYHCCNNVGEDVKVVNRWELVRNHLKKCNNFFNEFGLVEVEKKLQEAEQEYNAKKVTRKMIKKEKVLISIYSEQTNRSTESIASQNTNMSQISNPNKMSYYLARIFTYKEQDQFEKHILNMTIENGWSFRWVKCKSVIAHYHWLNPNLILPNCKQLAGRILKEAADGMQNIIKTKAQEDSNSIMLVFDEWKNVAKQKILGSILVTSRGELLIWKAKDISGEQKN